MQRIAHNPRPSTLKRKTPSVKSVDNLRKSKYSKVSQHHRKIPLIITELEQNLSLLKKYYYEEHPQAQLKITTKRPRPNRMSSTANGKQKFSKAYDHAEEETTTIAEIDDLKRSFLSMHGYETNNIVELYNFYRKNLEKSTRLFGSTSMSNMINLTQNHSEIRDRARPNTGYIISNDEPVKQKQRQSLKGKQNFEPKAEGMKLPSLYSDSLIKKSTDMVNVATLLADKKKISRKNICENMNSQNLLNQAKRKLYRPNPNQNIEKFCKLKQNMRSQNIRISPSRKFKNIELGKQRSNSKASHKKEQREKQREKEKEESGNKVAQKVQKYNKKSEQKIVSAKRQEIELQEYKWDIVVTEQAVKAQQKKTSSKKPAICQAQTDQQPKQLKELKSAKSSKSLKSLKSPPSIRSPSLNQAVLLDLTISAQPSSRKKSHHQPSYFVPRVHTNLQDSLLDCQITPKEMSKVIDLESIPFDF